MSLRRKVILLFGLLAIVPMLFLASFSYWHAQNLLKGTVQEQQLYTALFVAEELERVGGRINASLGALAGSLETDPFDSTESLAQVVTFSLDSVLSRAEYVAVRVEGNSPRFLAGNVPASPARCSAGRSDRLVAFSYGPTPSNGGGVIEAGYWGSELASLQGGNASHSVILVDQADGSVLFGAEGCPAQEDPTRSVRTPVINSALGMPGTQGTFGFKDGREEKVGTFARTTGSNWLVVVSSSLTDVLGPLRSLTRFYWMIVLALGVSTSLAFSLLIGRFTRSLSDLVRASEEIGQGEMDPWLPLPPSGELGHLTLAFSRMLARIRRMMSQVDHSGRLAVLGELSAYLAHEIRNPLSSIKLNLQRLSRWTQNGRIPDFCMEPLEISLREVERLNAAVTGVLQLSKAQDSPPEVLSLHDLVDEAADLLASKFQRQGVGLRLDLDSGADLVLARPGQLKGVILNLMVNALESQPDGGRLEIRSVLDRTPELGRPAVSLHFRDEGAGVPGDIRDRIFEPFFTTKAGGSGIGLAIAIQSVRDAGGDLHLEPSFSQNRGAEFVVVLPLAATVSRLNTGQGRVASRWRSDERNHAPTHLLSRRGLKMVPSPYKSETESDE